MQTIHIRRQQCGTNHNMKVPRRAFVGLAIGSGTWDLLYRPFLGPSIQAATRPVAPPTKWTGPSPAISTMPSFFSHPSSLNLFSRRVRLQSIVYLSRFSCRVRLQSIVNYILGLVAVRLQSIFYSQLQLVVELCTFIIVDIAHF